jgi:hypothetical protein
MKKMSKPKSMTFYVEGPDWEQNVSVDPTVCDDERSQLFEAATRAVEKQIKSSDVLNVGAILLVRKSKTAKKEAMVNAYICLVNAGQHILAENLRMNFKTQSGTDLAMDENGYSY